MLKERKGLEWRVKKRGKGHGMRIREASRQPAYRESGEHRLSWVVLGVAGLGPLLLSLSRASPWEHADRQPGQTAGIRETQSLPLLPSSSTHCTLDSHGADRKGRSAKSYRKPANL